MHLCGINGITRVRRLCASQPLTDSRTGPRSHDGTVTYLAQNDHKYTRLNTHAHITPDPLAFAGGGVGWGGVVVAYEGI